MKSITPFSLAAQLSKSKVSGSGFTPYFFTMPGSENSFRGIKAAKDLEKLHIQQVLRHSSKKLSKNEHEKS